MVGVPSPPQSWFKAVVYVSIPRMYPRSGYFLVIVNLNIEFDSREHKRKTYNSIRNFGIWQGVVLLFTGFFGGIFTGISGSGVDICSFSMLCLLFRVSEKVATPTSIVLMAINTSLGKKHFS